MDNLHLLTLQSPHAALRIAEDDMIHLTWKHATIRINVTGLIYLVNFLDGDTRYRGVSFDLMGSPDDGYQLWIQDAGLRLSADDYLRFKQLLDDGLLALRKMGKTASADHLPHALKLTVAAKPGGHFSQN